MSGEKQKKQGIRRQLERRGDQIDTVKRRREEWKEQNRIESFIVPKGPQKLLVPSTKYRTDIIQR